MRSLVFHRAAAGSFCAVLLFAGLAPAPPPPKEKADPEPREDAVKPALDPKEVAENPFLALAESRNRSKSKNNLMQIGIAAHSYHDAMGRLPSNIVDGNGKAILSWRVLLLPYLEQDKLYKKFNLKEPWDSKDNKKLLDEMPKQFASPRVKTAKNRTVYQTFAWEKAVFRAGKGLTFANITDGTSNTLMVVETSTTVPWSKPEDLPFDAKKGAGDFGKAYGDKPLGALLDGSVRELNLKKIKADTLRRAIDPSDGEVLGEDWER